MRRPSLFIVLLPLISCLYSQAQFASKGPFTHADILRGSITGSFSVDRNFYVTVKRVP